MTLLVGKLETLDKNNVLSIRREIAALKNKLKDCEASKPENVPVALAGPPPSPGECAPHLRVNQASEGPVRGGGRIRERSPKGGISVALSDSFVCSKFLS